MPPNHEDPLLRYGSTLAAVLIAVVLSVMLAATLAGQIEGEYRTRALAYTGLVIWVLVGAVVVFLLAYKGEASRLSVARVLLWTASIWFWPALLLLRPRRDGGEPPADRG
jgi:cytochrome bd-type quinol oxidase subunit 2